MSFVKNNTSHVLLTLGVLFTLGGATRFLPNGLAFAEDVGLVSGTASTGKAAATPAGAPDGSGGPSEVCFTTESAAMVAEDQWLFESQKEELKNEQIGRASGREREQLSGD